MTDETPILDKVQWGWQVLSVSSDKLQLLRDRLRGYGSCLVAYSGGVDSVFLAWVAREVLGERCLAALADSPSLPRREFEEAVKVASQFSIPVRIIKTEEFANADYLANPVNRCYFCKSELFQRLVPLARSEGIEVIIYGENASDTGDFRPGATAAEEFKVHAPLKEVGLTKEEIRQLSRQFGLPTADKPQMPCLSSRIPYGQPVTPAKLRMIELAENVLRDLGLREVRVRHHELPEGTGQALARIETCEMAKVFEHMDQIVQELTAVGYQHVTVDLRGYRRGSLNPLSPKLSPQVGLQR